MLLVLPIRADKRPVIPAVRHVDGTGRLQSVGPENPFFHRLIEEFERRTGVAVVLNTSFNLRGEPIVHRPEEAIADFSHTGMDALFLGNYLVEKASGGARPGVLELVASCPENPWRGRPIERPRRLSEGARSGGPRGLGGGERIGDVRGLLREVQGQ